MNPYRTLGVRKNADDATILKAYRRLSMRFHSDRNPGDEVAAAKFQEVAAAYDLLKDPIRRDLYDRTGNTDPPGAAPADREVAELCQVLQPILMAVLSEIGNGFEREQVGKIDVALRVKNRLRDDITAGERHRENVERGRKVLSEVCGRFTVKAGENILADITRSQLAQLEAELARTKADLDKLTRVKKYLEGVSYRRDNAPQSPTAADELLRMISANPKW